MRQEMSAAAMACATILPLLVTGISNVWNWQDTVMLSIRLGVSWHGNERCRLGKMYLSSCSIQSLSYTCVVLFLYLYLSSFSFCWCKFFTNITSTFSSFQVYILFPGNSFIALPFCLSSNYFFAVFFHVLKYLASPFLFIIRFFSVSSRIFINMYIVIKSPLSLLSFSVVSCISFFVMLGLPILPSS